MSAFTTFDYPAVPWFLLRWIGYNRYSEGPGVGLGNFAGVMKQRRHDWTPQMLARDNRIVNTQIVRSLVQRASFFATTSILVVASLVTGLVVTDKAIALIRDLPLVEMASRQLWADVDRQRAENASCLWTNASPHSSRGGCVYYFGLAVLAWFLHPIALMLSVVLVVLVLYRGEFRSQTFRLLQAHGTMGAQA